jgi:hypothetical protein
MGVMLRAAEVENDGRGRRYRPLAARQGDCDLGTVGAGFFHGLLLYWWMSGCWTEYAGCGPQIIEATFNHEARVLVAVATLKLIHKIVIRFSGVGFGAKTVASVSLALIL